jgi:hypothetical protein
VGGGTWKLGADSPKFLGGAGAGAGTGVASEKFAAFARLDSLDFRGFLGGAFGSLGFLVRRCLGASVFVADESAAAGLIFGFRPGFFRGGFSTEVAGSVGGLTVILMCDEFNCADGELGSGLLRGGVDRPLAEDVGETPRASRDSS